MAVSVQTEDFDIGQAVRDLTGGRTDIGALVTFTGLVRDAADGSLEAMELEHYPAMTEKALQEIEAQARERWDLSACLIIHRVGRLEPGDRIMMVATASAHRRDAFESAEFLMDFLKSRAPFWKKEHSAEGENWVDAKDSDEEALDRWQR
jgi:molybdopterin synthase catalytic subunit